MALNVSFTASRSARSSSGRGTAASVVTNPSIVAIIGSIMPEPLAIPPTKMSCPAIVARADASFGNGSVVMIARAAAAPWSAASARSATGKPERIFSIGRATPITPVEATSTCGTGQPISRAVSDAISRAARYPSSPVQAFAQPLLTTIARATLSDRSRCSRERTTGAACARFIVKTAAAVAAVSDTRSARSGAPLALIPALTPAALNPAGVVTPPLTTATVMRAGRPVRWWAEGTARRPFDRPTCRDERRSGRRAASPERHRRPRRGERPSRIGRTGGIVDT